MLLLPGRLTLLPFCCHGFFFGFGVLLPCSCSVIVVVLPCYFFVFDVGKRALFDLYVTSAPVGHHVPFQPLVTGPHIHPSPASSPPSSSSPSTLPSSSQSSVTGPPRFFFSYPLFPHYLSFNQGESAVCKCIHFILSLLSTDSASLVCPVC